MIDVFGHITNYLLTIILGSFIKNLPIYNGEKVDESDSDPERHPKYCDTI